MSFSVRSVILYDGISACNSTSLSLARLAKALQFLENMGQFKQRSIPWKSLYVLPQSLQSSVF
jgi:hypothetical protein